jgi:hypothetical protein
MKAPCWLVLAEVALWSSGMLMADGSDVVVLNEDIEVLHAERMSYPLAGRVHVIEGAVVVKVELGKDGIVHHAAAVSGPKLLINDCLKNAKEWRFKRVGHGTAFIVYVFQIKGLCELPCSSNFEFYPPNVALINMGSPLATP